MRYLRRKDKISSSDLKEFCEKLITEFHTIYSEDRPEISLEMTKDYYINTKNLVNFHGSVNWIFKADEAKFTPVMFFNSTLNPAAGIGMALSNM